MSRRVLNQRPIKRFIVIEDPQCDQSTCRAFATLQEAQSACEDVDDGCDVLIVEVNQAWIRKEPDRSYKFESVVNPGDHI